MQNFPQTTESVSNNAITVLVTGGSGFIGQALCSELLRRRYTVHEAKRTAIAANERSSLAHESFLVGPIDSNTDWTSAIAKSDIVIHLAARVHVMRENASNPLDEFRKVNVEGTEHLARSAAARGVKRLVYVSSIKVNGEVTQKGEKFTELDAPSPHDPYGVSKCEAEHALHEISAKTGMEVVIVRPPLVYGAGMKGNFVQMMNVLAKGIPLPLSSAKNLRSLIYVGNLVDALILCAMHPAAANQTYLVSDDNDLSTPDLLRQLGEAMGRPARLFPCHPMLLKFVARLAGKSDQVARLLGSLQVDSSKIHRELGWQPGFTMQQGIKQTVDWYRSARSSS